MGPTGLAKANDACEYLQWCVFHSTAQGEELFIPFDRAVVPHSHQARAVLGPNINIHNFGYGCTEGLRGKAINLGESGDLVLENEDVVEFLDVTNGQTANKIVQAVCISTPSLPFSLRTDSPFPN